MVNLNWILGKVETKKGVRRGYKASNGQDTQVKKAMEGGNLIVAVRS